MSGKLIVVSGAQYGSEAKGALTGYLTSPERSGRETVVVRVAGPNAGHTVYGICPEDCEPTPDHMFNDEWIGHPWKLRTVPVGAVTNPDATLVIAGGSEVDPTVLRSEVESLEAAGYKVRDRLVVDASATLLTFEHIAQEQEKSMSDRIGSTAKGIGAARADRVWRTATLWGDFARAEGWSLSKLAKDTGTMLTEFLWQGYTVAIEGTQGYGLGQHAGVYPQCTSSDCRALDFLAMAGVSPWHPAVGEFEVWLATRVRPIRVAGNSGPLKGETSWDALGLTPERTTVTNKVRRVGEWDAELVRRAVNANGGAPTVKLGLTMVDTLLPGVAGVSGGFAAISDDDTPAELENLLSRVEYETGAPVGFVGTSPVTGFFTRGVGK